MMSREAAAASTINLTLPDERQRLILERLARDGRVLAGPLARELGTSEDTVRRDLRDLASAGLCQRVYGGALPLAALPSTLAVREAQAPERKAALGAAAARLVQPGSVVLIDAGSTNLAIARALPPGLNVTVVTNAPAISATLSGRADIELVVVGGRVDHRLGASLGARALRDARDIRTHLAFLGTCAVGADTGVAAFDLEEAEFKRAVAERAGAVAIAVTSDKLGTTAPFTVLGTASLAHLVAEADAPEPPLAAIRSLGVEVMRAGAAS